MVLGVIGALLYGCGDGAHACSGLIFLFCWQRKAPVILNRHLESMLLNISERQGGRSLIGMHPLHKRTEMPEQMEMKLSDAFEREVEQPQLELRVTMMNINPGMNASSTVFWRVFCQGRRRR